MQSAPTKSPRELRLSLPAATAAEQAGDAVIAQLHAAGHAAYRVGGCVRDRLLGRAAPDVDVATAAVPEQVQALFRHTYAVGASFGVVVVHAAEGVDIEVATFREDGGYQDGRHPDCVTFCGAAEDAARRDFTINALFYDPSRQTLVDFVDGLADLERGVVRAIGIPAARFAEDSLRLLRAVRFTAELGFVLDPDTAAAIQPLAGTLTRVSAERVFAELTRMLTGRNPAGAFDLLQRLALLPVCLPELAAMPGVPQPPQFHPEGDVWQHTLDMLRGLRAASPTLAWAVLLHDVGKPPTFSMQDGRERFFGHARTGAAMAAAILERLHASGQLTADVARIVEHHMTLGDVSRMRQAKVRRILGRPTFADDLELHRIDCRASHGDFANYVFLLDALIRLAEEPPIPPPLATGDDVLALGVPRGPRIGRLLREVQERQLEGDLHTREEALAWLRAAVAAPPDEPGPGHAGQS